MNNYIQKIVEAFDFNSIQNDNNKADVFVENVLGVVDLGLPSGTLWCKCNLGTNTETEYGDYYSWGELTTKNDYSDENYTYRNKPKQLPLKHDVASQKLGKNYSIPTKKQLDELLKYTNKKWVENYNGTGINGMVFKGKNGNTLFIPTAGYRNSSLNGEGSYSYIWSSSCVEANPYHAWYLGIYCGRVYVSLNYRYDGLSIRPVLKK